MGIKLINASDGTGEAGIASVTATRLVGSTTIAVNSVAHWPAFFIATAGPKLPNNTLDPAKTIVFAGHTSGSSIVIDTIAPGYTDIGNTNTDVVVIKPATQWADNIGSTFAVAHKDDGSLKDASVNYATLLSTIFSGQSTAYTNPGSAGGTFRYVNIGGIKIFYGTTNANAVGTGGASFQVTYPVGFFTNIDYADVSIFKLTTSPSQTVYVQPGTDNTKLVFSITSSVNGSTQSDSVLVIGT